jgi:hypothetical protein
VVSLSSSRRPWFLQGLQSPRRTIPAPRGRSSLRCFRLNWKISAPPRPTFPPEDIDREQLRLSTEEARRLIAQSGRYQLIDVGAVSDEAAKAGKLHDCDGCEARIAADLNADQSMIGIVTRISRTDYAVTYKIRDARSGALVDVEQTDLRAGANSAWSRGARWLIQRRLLEQ